MQGIGSTGDRNGSAGNDHIVIDFNAMLICAFHSQTAAAADRQIIA